MSENNVFPDRESQAYNQGHKLGLEIMQTELQALQAENARLKEFLRDACNELKQRELAGWLTDLIEKALEEEC